MISSPPSVVIATLIETLGSRQLGTDLFVSVVPDEPESTISLYDTIGIKADKAMCSGAQRIEKYGVQMLARDRNYLSMWEELTGLCNAFEAVDGLSITVGSDTFTIANINVDSGPFFIGNSEQKESNVFSVNLLCSVR
jgi:hypothetical protein